MIDLEEIYNKYVKRVRHHKDSIRLYRKDQLRWYTTPFKERREANAAETATEALQKKDLGDLDDFIVLDLACGVPYLWEYLFKRFGIRNFVGVDLLDSEVMTNIVREQPYDYSYRQENVFEFVKSEENLYDLVISGNALFVDDSEKVKHFTESVNVLLPLVKKGGILVYEYNKVKQA